MEQHWPKWQKKRLTAQYEPEDNILHTWFTQPTSLDDDEQMEHTYHDMLALIKACPRKPYLLFSYANATMGSGQISNYAEKIKTLQPLLLGTVRFGFSADLSGKLMRGAISVGNIKINTAANIYPDEASARAALKKMQQEQIRKG